MKSNRSSLLILVLALLSGVPSFAADEASPPSWSNPEVEMHFGMGWTWRSGADFDDFLREEGLPPLDAERLLNVDWRIAFSAESAYYAIAGSRSSNFLLGPYGEGTRMKLTWDETELSLGWMPIDGASFKLGIGAGVGVSSYLLQAWPEDGGAFGDLFSSPGQADLVSRWNWFPVAELWANRRFFKKEKGVGLVLGLYAQAGYLPADTAWRLFDDPEVSGVPGPADYFFRVSFQAGFR